MAPLARLQYTLELHRNGTAFISTAGSPGFLLSTQPPKPIGDGENCTADGDSIGNAAGSGSLGVVDVTEGGFREDVGGIMPIGEHGWTVAENQSRLLPPVVIPQVKNGNLCRFPLV